MKIQDMTLTKLIRSIALTALPLTALCLSAPGQAQNAPQKQDPGVESQRAAQAAKDAERVRAENERAVFQPLRAMVDPTPENIWVLKLSTGGEVRIALRPDVAPKTVERIKTLTREGFYNGLLFHRVIEGFMAQGGDPKGDGTGGSSMPDLEAEFNWLPHMRGTVSMARAQDDNSANSQFFIMLMPRFQLDHKYTAFGRVISGMASVDAISMGEPPPEPTRIVQAQLATDAESAKPSS
jgi:cyclophilin family peptidyl-prolyl cis-trans isomerase